MNDKIARAATATHARPTAHEALETLHKAAAQTTAPVATGVIATVGRDVPVELVRAAGFQPLRLRGNTEWSTVEAEHYLGRGLDETTRSMLAGILDGAYGQLDGILISSDCDASQRMFYVLRELRRIGERPDLPPVHLVDVLHLRRESSARYNLRKLEELCDVLDEWRAATAENTLAATDIEQAVAEANHDRELQRQVMALRSLRPSPLSGVDALAVFAAADRLPRAEYRACLEALAADGASLAAHEGTRVFITGSTHDSPAVYEQIEGQGYVVVGEDHDWGEMLAQGQIAIGEAEEGGEDQRIAALDAIARHYQCASPTSQRASIRERADFLARGVAERGAEQVLSYVRELDEAPLWDFAAQRDVAGVPAGVLVSQKYGKADAAELELALTSPEKTGVNR